MSRIRRVMEDYAGGSEEEASSSDIISSGNYKAVGGGVDLESAETPLIPKTFEEQATDIISAIRLGKWMDEVAATDRENHFYCKEVEGMSGLSTRYGNASMDVF